MSGFTAEQMLQLKETVVEGVRQGLSEIGLGYDDETEKKSLRQDFDWTRAKRLAEGDAAKNRSRSVRGGVWTVASVAATAGLLYLLLHLADFGHFLISIASAAK